MSQSLSSIVRRVLIEGRALAEAQESPAAIDSSTSTESSHLVSDEKKRAALLSLDSVPEKKRDINWQVARLAAVHGETGSFMVPKLPDHSDESGETANRSRAALQGSLAHDALASAEEGITSLARLGITIAASFRSVSGRDAIVVRGKSGRAYAFYVSTGTGTGTKSGTWTPYKGNSISYIEQSYRSARVSKLRGDRTGMKVPFVDAGEERAVFDALNHPEVRDAVNRIPSTGSYAGDGKELHEMTVREFVDEFSRTGRENTYLSHLGVDLAGSDFSPRTDVLPWASEAPIPLSLRGMNVLSLDKLLKGVRFSIANSSRFPDGVYDLGDAIKYNMSFVNMPLRDRDVFAEHTFEGGNVVGPYSRYSQPSTR